VVLALTALHGFVATYLYTNYLRNEIDSAPLSLTLLIWIILGAMTGYVSNRLIELKDKLKTSDAIIDATFYALVFACATLAVSPQIGPNAALILALLGLILCVVPFSRFFISCKRIKFNRRGSKRKPGRSVLYTLVSLPTLVPFFAILYVVELLSADLSLFFFNLISLSLVAYISFAMLSRMNNTIGNEVGDTDEAAEAVAEPARTGVDEPAAAPAMDPLIAELLAEEAAAQEEQPAGSAQIEKTAMVPPSKPGRPQARKEEKTQAAKGTANAKQAADAAKAGDPFKMNGRHNPSGVTLKVKAPSKPNKRF
ncbi:MAG TPA: hypothetical protein VJ952_13985, partial [Opitutales bacterium]|nr:hypothetical protein [Opitutales bacterium]